MISLKKQYAASLVGWAMLFFGLGWVILSQIINLQFGFLLGVGIGILIGGLAVVIVTLRTIKSIDMEIETE